MKYFDSRGRYQSNAGNPRPLLSIETDAKTSKNAAHGYLTGILYLAPAKVAGGPNVCPFATEDCLGACLYLAGKGGLSSVQRARIRKTRAYHSDRPLFIQQLARDVHALVRKAAARNLRAAVRLNGTSDIAWELIAPQLFAEFPNVQWYDYTKIPARMRRGSKRLPSNYHLTFSVSEQPTSLKYARAIVRNGGSAAVVLGVKRSAPMPPRWYRFGVTDADQHDLRFLDKRGTWSGLRPKGTARNLDVGGFVHAV